MRESHETPVRPAACRGLKRLRPAPERAVNPLIGASQWPFSKVPRQMLRPGEAWDSARVASGVRSRPRSAPDAMAEYKSPSEWAGASVRYVIYRGSANPALYHADPPPVGA